MRRLAQRVRGQPDILMACGIQCGIECFKYLGASNNGNILGHQHGSLEFLVMNYISADQAQKIQWLLRDCGQQAKRMAAQQFEVFQKGIDDYVTTVDRALDERLRSSFTQMFPQDGVITEEDQQSRQAFHANYRRLWCIDPLDGTDDFIQRKAHYSVMAGLLADHQPVLGWIYAPEFDRSYWGGIGWGLFQSDGDRPPQPLMPTAPPPLTADQYPVLIGSKDRRRFGPAISELIPQAQFDSIGSFGLKVMEVICGRAGLYIYFNGRVKLWDTTGPLALARAAGLTCCDLEGQPLRFTADAIDPETLAHYQPIVIGWPDYVAALRSPIQQAVTGQPPTST